MGISGPWDVKLTSSDELVFINCIVDSFSDFVVFSGRTVVVISRSGFSAVVFLDRIDVVDLKSCFHVVVFLGRIVVVDVESGL